MARIPTTATGSSSASGARDQAAMARRSAPTVQMKL